MKTWNCGDLVVREKERKDSEYVNSNRNTKISSEREEEKEIQRKCIECFVVLL